MNQTYLETKSKSLGEPVDVLLADVAIRIQLSRTSHRTAVERYETIGRWLDREGSPLRGLVTLLYPQGSMAIGATIARRLRTDEFDIDGVVELILSQGVPPKEVLDLLFESLRGERGSRYYAMVERRTRCVTVHYEDMHLDVTPAVLVPGQTPKTSVIFHHKPEDRSGAGYRLWANPWGFAEWFKRMTPRDQHFADLFAFRASELESGIRIAAAETDPVPNQEGPHQKSKAVVALQLLKRWRNVRYDRRNSRRPPSILLAKLIADAANHTQTLSEELLLQAESLRSVFRGAHERRELLHAVNPTCDDDVLTDRWPSTFTDQGMFLEDLEDLVAKVGRLKGDCDLAEMREIMSDLFGEAPTGQVFETFNEEEGRRIRTGGSRHLLNGGRLVLGRTGASAGTGVSVSRATKGHTFFGS